MLGLPMLSTCIRIIRSLQHVAQRIRAILDGQSLLLAVALMLVLQCENLVVTILIESQNGTGLNLPVLRAMAMLETTA